MKKVLIAILSLLFINVSFAKSGTKATSATCVSGTVIDAGTKKPLADVTIIAVNANNKSEVVTTNSLGQFKITSLAQGTYTLKLTKEDYRNQEKKDIVVKTDASTKVTVEMYADDGEEANHRSWWDKFDLYI